MIIIVVFFSPSFFLVPVQLYLYAGTNKQTNTSHTPHTHFIQKNFFPFNSTTMMMMIIFFYSLNLCFHNMFSYQFFFLFLFFSINSLFGFSIIFPLINNNNICQFNQFLFFTLLNFEYETKQKIYEFCRI